MNITADAVKQLRERTGAGMMECKKALVETKGDLDAAADLMRKQGLAKADKKASRVAAEGVVVVENRATPTRPPWSRSTARPISSPASRTSAPLRRRSPTYALRRSRLRWRLCCAAKLAGGETVDERRRALIAKIGENISVRRFAVLTSTGSPGRVRARHAHRCAGGGEGWRCRSGARPRDARGREQPEVPEPGAIPADVVAERARILTEQAQGEGKPPEIVAKMVEGRLRKSLGEITLAGQPFVKDPDVTIEKLLKGAKAKSPPSSVSRSAQASRRSRRTSSPRSWRRCESSTPRSTDEQISQRQKTPPRAGFFPSTL